MTENYFERTDCRLCSGPLVEGFRLTPTPLANEIVGDSFLNSGEIQQIFPLFVSVCSRCGHIQLPVVVDPSKLFRNYYYTSGVSPVFVEHFRRYADDVSSSVLQRGDLVVDIGSNDGTFLQFFKKLGMRILGVDPALNIAEIAMTAGVPTVSEFFTLELAKKLATEHGKAKLITANNVFAHADNLADIASGVRELLSDDGVFVFEVSYFPDVVSKTLFDTIYHEHLSYHHIGPLVDFFNNLGLVLFDAHRVDTQGGSIRVFVGHKGRYQTTRLIELMLDEAILGLRVPTSGFADPPDGIGRAPLVRLHDQVELLKQGLGSLLHDIKSRGYSIAGFGAPAKITTLMYHFDLGINEVEYIVDDSKLKQGMYTPGKHIPILDPSVLYERSPNYVVILVWNFADSIMNRHPEYRAKGGKFIVPIPELKVHG